MNNLPRYIFGSFAPLFLFFLLFPPVFLFSQATSISGVINHFAAVTEIDTCSGKLTVSDTAGFRPGGAVLLIQMQGAEIVSDNNFLYGIIESMNFAGRYERAVIDSVGANALFVQKRLVYTYSVPGKLQVVSIPQYTHAVVTDTLKCQPWNGATGGVLALEVAGKLTLNAPVLADGAGFRGGAAYVGSGNNCNFLVPEVGFYYAFPNWRGGYKGEGIALPEVGKELGRGPQANGGGGGNDHNSGGGGGGNVTDGGNGGENDEPSLLGCDGYYPGVRGYGAFFTAGRMFMGGGGGAGHSNNTSGGAGANGGGIIVIEAGDIDGTFPVVSANGRSAAFSNGDGAGGGGAGGTIWLKVNSAPAGIIVRANGGIGGNTINNNANRCFGPGGGGAGGRILTNLFGIAAPGGGLAGVVTGSTNGCNGTTGGAGNGDGGIVDTLPALPQGSETYIIPQIVGSPLPDTLCPGKTATFLVLANNGDWDYQWQVNNGSGWIDITGGAQFTGFQNDTLTVTNVTAGQNGLRFRCRVLRAGCYEVISGEAAIVLSPAPSAGFTTTQNGLTVDFSNQSVATGYFWDFGDGATSQAVSPQHTYATEGAFTVTLYAITDCDTALVTQTVVTLSPPVAGFTAPSLTTGCGSASVTLTNTSSPGATSFSWSFPGGTPATSNQQNPTVSYPATGFYPVTLVASNAAGQDTFVQFVAVTVLPQPVADFAFFVQPDGTVQFADQSQNANGLLWNFGDNTTSTDPDPLHVYAMDGNYTVTLTVWNDCDTVSYQQTVAAFFPPAAGFFVQDTTPGCQSSVVEFENTSSANASAFSWSFPGGDPATSNALNPSISYAASGTYTAQLIVSNAIGSDTTEQTFTVQILDFPVANFTYTFFPGGVVRFTNTSQQALSYSWDFGDGTPQVNGATNIDHQFPASGAYVVTLIATNPCGVSILQQTIEVVVSGVATGEPQGLGVVRLFPNPASERLAVDCSEATAQPLEIQVFDAGGKRCFGKDFSSATKMMEVSLDNLPAGTYQVRVQLENGFLTRMVVKI
ncbi:MAG: PKD domain-containing protein [Haliscomenobacteraceae bacterium CHB4]|nr:PKD domain-containing protein [Haliscomenobacteraceae bacterium CHB4]